MLVTSAAEVIEHLSPVGAARPEPPPGQDGQAGQAGRAAAVLNRDQLTPEAAAVLDALPARGGMGTAKVAVRAGLDPATVLRCLGMLAATGFVERCDEGWRLRRTLRRATAR
jgi:DNA processing protein